MFLRSSFFGLFLGLFASCFFLNCAQARLTLDNLFYILKDSAIDLQHRGTICEEVEKIILERRYPVGEFKVVSGIEFRNSVNETLGEMDLVVFNRRTRYVEFVGEVKCCGESHLERCAKRARDQLERAQRILQGRDPISFDFRAVLDSTGLEKLSTKSFQRLNESNFGTISQKGGEEYFDETLDYTLSEMIELRQRIIDCQMNGTCPRPSLKVTSRGHKKRADSMPEFPSRLLTSSVSSLGSSRSSSPAIPIPGLFSESVDEE